MGEISPSTQDLFSIVKTENKEFTVFPLSAWPCALVKLDVDNEKIIKTCKQQPFTLLLEDQPYLCHNAYIGKNRHILETFPRLKNQIEYALQNYITKILEVKAKAKITKSWATKVTPGGYANRHSHSNNWISMCYYPSSYNQKTRITFMRRHAHVFEAKIITPNLWNSFTYHFTPQDGTLAIWPAQLEHRIDTNTSSEDRYSIACNALPVGEIGLEDNVITFHERNI